MQDITFAMESVTKAEIDKLPKIEEYVKNVIEKLDNLTLENDENYKNASELLAQMKVRSRRIDEIRKEIIKPFREIVNENNARYGEKKELLDTLISSLEKSMKEYFLKKEEAARIEAEKARLENVKPIEALDQTVKTETGVTTAKKLWKFQIVAPAKVPLDFWEISEKKIGDAVRNGRRKISGVNIYQDISIATRQI